MKWLVVETREDESDNRVSGHVIEADTPEQAALEAARAASVHDLLCGRMMLVWPFDFTQDFRVQYENPDGGTLPGVDERIRDYGQVKVVDEFKPYDSKTTLFR